MNAINFIQKHGIDKAREVVEGAPDGTCFYCHEFNIGFIEIRKSFCDKADQFHTISISDLKRLVESVCLVKEHHTLDRAIEYANSPYAAPEIKVCLLDAISDYKSIYGGSK